MSKSGKHFSEKFYTDDFDQDMLDFIKRNYDFVNCEDFLFKLNTENTVLRYDNYADKFVVTRFNMGEYLTKQEFKEKIGMTNKSTFTKDDLVAGKHVVVYRNGDRRFVMHDGALVGLNGCSTLDSFDETLLAGYSEMDIVKVYNIDHLDSVKQLLEGSLPYPLVWERIEKSDAQLQYEDIQAKMKELQAQLDKLEPQIK